jgi:hypothetical protein
MIGFVAVYTLALSAALMAGCRPFAANFDRTIPGSTCYAPETFRALGLTNSGEWTANTSNREIFAG